jgi:predicted MFS family arabinose efflux permease
LHKINAVIAPRHLGRNFPWIWSSSTVANLGDGVVLAAGPLLVASITTQPFPVAMALFAQRLPWFIFGLQAGAIIDRVDRRRLVMVVDFLRAGVLTLLAISVALEVISLEAIYAAMFLLGSAETFADNAGGALTATAVPKDALGQANARLYGARIVTNQLAGPPLGALFFAAGAVYPFGFNAICFVLSAVLIARIRLQPNRQDLARPGPVRTQVLEGLRWLASHAAVRTLAIMITAFNVTFGAAFSILVLYARERLGLDDLGFGLLLAASAVGGLVGSAIFGRLEKRYTYATILRVGLIIETLTHLILAITRSPFLAAAVMITFGAHAVIWGTTSTTVRQRSVPASLLGRVTSVYMIGGLGALALGSLLGGAIAQRWGVVAPFWFAFVGTVVILLFTWRSIAYVTHEAQVTSSGLDDVGQSHV